MPESTNGFVGCDLFSGVYYQDLNKKTRNQTFPRRCCVSATLPFPAIFRTAHAPSPWAPKFCLFFLFLQCRAKNKCFSHTGHFPRKPWGLTQNDLGKTGCGFPFRSSLSLSCLIWGFLRPLRVLLSCPGVLASPPLYCCLFGFLGCPVPSYLPTCVYIYISPGSFPISFLDTNNPHCIGRTTWHLALHCITLHCIAVHCIALHCIAWHYIALHCIALHCIHCLTLHRNALHYVALHFIALHYIQLHYIASHCITLHCTCAAQTSVSCRGFLSGVLFRNSLGFLWLSPRVFKVLLRIHTGENKAKNLGFHLGIL